MTLEHTGLTEEQVMAVRDRSLEAAYEIHDVGQTIVIARLEAHGYHVVEHGDDARHADEVFYGDGPDLAVYRHFDEHEQEPVDLLAYIELKCKEDEQWFGRCNRRHFTEYVNFSNEQSVPVFIWFGLVDADTEQVHREAFIEVEDTDQIDGDVVDVSEQGVVFHASDIECVEEDSDLRVVAADDLVGVRARDTIVDFIPNVHGNDVVELNDDEFRSWPHFFWRLEQ